MTTELRLDALRRPHQRPARKRPAVIALRTAGYLVLIVCAAGLLLPFFWMVMSSLKGQNEVFTVQVHWLPSVFVWDNYLRIWQHSNILTWIRNTVILSVVVTFLQVLTGSFAAYGFAKVRFPGRDVLFLLYVGTIAVPWQSYMIPQFILMSDFKLNNTLYSVMLIQAFGAFGVFLMRQYYLTIPGELSEAARIDGLSEYGLAAIRRAARSLRKVSTMNRMVSSVPPLSPPRMLVTTSVVSVSSPAPSAWTRACSTCTPRSDGIESKPHECTIRAPLATACSW